MKILISMIFLSSLLASQLFAQSNKTIEFNKENWNFIASTAIENIDGRSALRFGGGDKKKFVTFGAAKLKNIALENGVIEYDVRFGETRTFVGLNFRGVSKDNKEDFYIRAHQSGNPDANQYMPIYNGVSAWQLYYGDQFSSPTKYKFNQWMHIKLVINNDLADIYIDNDTKPEYTVRLKREQASGAVTLWGADIGGPAWISNFKIDPNSTQKVIGTPIKEKIAMKNTVSTWNVSNAIDSKMLQGVTDLSTVNLKGLKYTKMNIESTGLLNLAKLQGVKKGNDTALVKLVISSDKKQVKKLTFGFSDSVTVFLNNKAILSASDKYRTRDYRFLGTIGYYDTAYLNLEKGDNELILAITESHKDKTGWGVQGYFDNLSNIKLKN